MTMLKIPPALRSGDTISLVAPSGPIDTEALSRAVTELERRGYRTKTYRDITHRDGYLAGSDTQRIDEFNQALTDPETNAVLPIRGGYGAVRIVSQLDYNALAARPKLLCGFSDITAIHAAIHRHAGVATFHGPNLQDGLGREGGLDPCVAGSYWQAITGESAGSKTTANTTLPSPTALAPGQCEGPLVGGNLAVLCGLIGTPFEPDSKGAILLLEDIGEALYRIDRMLAQLRLAGKFESLAGVVLGQFTDCQAKEGDSEQQLDRLFHHYFADLGVPVVANYPVGHTPLNLTVPLGLPICLDADACCLDLGSVHAKIHDARTA